MSRAETAGAGLFVAVLVLLAGCRGSGSEIEITYGTPLTNSAPITSSDPDPACGALTDADIQAILPQAEKITHSRQSISIMTPPSSQGQALQASGCDFRYKLPSSSESGPGEFIGVQLLFSPSPDQNKAQFEQDSSYLKRREDVGSSWGPQQCAVEVDHISEAVCLSGRCVFKVSTMRGDGSASDQEWSDRVLKPLVQTLAAKTK